MDGAASQKRVASSSKAMVHVPLRNVLAKQHWYASRMHGGKVKRMCMRTAPFCLKRTTKKTAGCVHFQIFSLQTLLFTYHIKFFISCMEH